MRIDRLYLENEPAIRKEDLTAIIADIDEFDGWIRCKTSTPAVFAPVFATDGTDIAIGCYLENPKEFIVTNNFTRLKARNIIAWRLLPHIPIELIEKCKA